METAYFMDDLLDFSSDIGEEDEDEHVNNKRSNKRPRKALPLNSHGSTSFDVVLNPEDPTYYFPEFAEEELEWLSNKDAFPAVETFVDILSNPLMKHQSPDSVLENSNSSSTTTSSSSEITNSINNSINNSIITTFSGRLVVPVRPRSKSRRRLRREAQSDNSIWSFDHESTKNVKRATSKVTIGRKCQHCGAEKTPQWRAGPMGPKTLCNACGVRYKSGRLVPEYRPASSPTFSSELHSNSHRKVMEMRRQNQMTGSRLSESGKEMVKSVDKG